MMGQHVEVGLVVIAGCYFLFCAHTTYVFVRIYLVWVLWEYGFGFGVCMDMGVGWVGKARWESGMGWEDGMGNGKRG